MPNKSSSIDISTQIGKLKLRAPVLPASGTFGYGEEYRELIDYSRIGAVVTKGITLKPRQGHPPPRGVETPSGMLNCIGLQNPGVDVFIKEKLSFFDEIDIPCIVNIAGDTPEEYGEVAARLDEGPQVSAIEINVSCPNVKQGGIAFGADPRSLGQVVSEVRKRTSLPLITKLSPNVTDIVTMARAAVDAGTDAISLINTLVGMAIDLETRKPILSNITGGLSGPAIKPVALRMVYQVYQAVKAPIIGMGGIADAKDALEFIFAGASAVAVGTALFYHPDIMTKITDGIAEYMTQNNISKLSDLVGCSHS